MNIAISSAYPATSWPAEPTVLPPHLYTLHLFWQLLHLPEITHEDLTQRYEARMESCVSIMPIHIPVNSQRKPAHPLPYAI